MIIKELITHLQTFDESHKVQIEVLAECQKFKGDIKDVQFKYGDCVLFADLI